MTRWLPLVTAAVTRGLIRVVLQTHPREFRHRFGQQILRDVTDDIYAAAANGSIAAGRAGVTAIADAIAALRTARTSLSYSWEKTMSTRTWVGDAWHDVRLGIRTFRRERAFSLSVMATLALGIGVNAAMFGVADRLLLRGPEHVRDIERVRRVQIAMQRPGMDVHRSGWFGYVAYDALRREAESFEAVAAYSVAENSAILGRGIDARRINRGEATASLFSLLGVTPALGRFYTEQEDDTVTPAPVVVIGYGLWQRDFGGQPDVIGRSIVLDSAEYKIVGVAPAGFTGPDLLPVDVWMPESLIGRRVTSPGWTQSWNASWLSLVVRLKPGVADERADVEATTIFRRAYTGPSDAQRNATLAVRPLIYSPDGMQSMESQVSTWLVAVAAIVLLVSCANVVNLLLAHGIGRRRELAVRVALGAGRGRIARLLIVETLALAAAGGALGLAVAYGVGTMMRSWLIPGVEWPSGPVNIRVLSACGIVSLAAGLLVAVLPALRSSAPDVSGSLKAGVREGGGRWSRVRAALTMAQAALSALLLVGSGLFVVSLMRVRAVDLGLQPDRVLTFSILRSAVGTISDEAERQRERDRRTGFYPAVVERLRQRPDVEAASLTVGLPFMSGFGESIRVPGRDSIPQLKGGGPFLAAVSAGYFETVGTRIVRGRGFTIEDRAGSAPVAVVNETMAATLWPGGDAIGQCFYVAQSTACAEIVGVAVDTHQFNVQEDEAMAFYLPLGQQKTIFGTQLLVRPRGEADHVLEEVRRELIALDPTIIYVYAGILQDRVDPQVRPWRLGATMFSLMGVLALVVGAVGIYSVVSYFVTHRTHEIGVRMALGARPADVARIVFGGGLAMAAGGVAIGLVLALLVARFVEPLLFQTSPRDPVVFTSVALALVATGLLATVLPALRAGRVNPVEAMRAE